MHDATLWRPVRRRSWGASGRRRAGWASGHRLANLARAIFYGAVTYGILKYALGVGAPSSSDKESQDLTAEALKVQGGQVIVGVVGAVVIGAGLYVPHLPGLPSASSLKHLRLGFGLGQDPARYRHPGSGQIGRHRPRRVVFASRRAFFLIIAAQDANPKQAKGIDTALRALAHTPAGPWLLIVIALGLVTFGAYSWCEARWRAV